LPQLAKLYRVRVEFKRIFDTAPNRRRAAYRLCALELKALDEGLDLSAFFRTYDNWQEEILNYFDDRQTSAAVEGVNNKARVIIKRSYGLRSVNTLWDRLILDLNRATAVVRYTIEGIREVVAGLKTLFSPPCT
jgi:transposase